MTFPSGVWHALHFDFGISYQFKQPVVALIGERLPATMELAFVSALFALVLGIPMGVYTALNRGSWVSTLLLTVSQPPAAVRAAGPKPRSMRVPHRCAEPFGRSAGPSWWNSIRGALDTCETADDAAQIGQDPLAALLLVDPALKPEVAAVVSGDPRVATALANALSPEETYDLVGGPTVIEAWRRNHAETSGRSGTNAPSPGWDFWAWELYLKWTIEPTPALWSPLLHLIKAVDESELMQVGIDYLEDLLSKHPSQYAERLIESALSDPRVARSVCIYHLPEGYEDRIYEVVGRRPGAASSAPQSSR